MLVSTISLRALVMATFGGLLVAQVGSSQGVSDARYWAQWRGPEASGVSRTATPPVEWSETENIRWKIEIPGRGASSPVVWEDRVFLTTAIPQGVSLDVSHDPRGGLRSRGVHQFVVMAISRDDGSVIWERIVREEEPHEASHVDNGTWASNSVVTDGEHLFAYFESRGLYAFDLDGNLQWEIDFGDKAMRNQFGEGSTPALYGDRLVVVWDHLGGQSFVVTLDKNTGEEVWRVDRDEIDTWATPLVVEADARTQVIVPGMERLRSYDLADGSVVWESDGLTMNPIPSPVHADGIMIAMSGFRGNDLKAVRLAGASGDVTGTDAIVWERDRDTPYVPSPLLYDGVLYFLKSNSGILTALDATTGEPVIELQRLANVPNVFASPVGADGRIYFPGRDGATLVIRQGAPYEVLATNVLDDGFDASPALVDNEIYLRGYRYLYSIGEE
jgi:outer membrane protein assembly factor BamB